MCTGGAGGGWGWGGGPSSQHCGPVPPAVAVKGGRGGGVVGKAGLGWGGKAGWLLGEGQQRTGRCGPALPPAGLRGRKVLWDPAEALGGSGGRGMRGGREGKEGIRAQAALDGQPGTWAACHNITFPLHPPRPAADPPSLLVNTASVPRSPPPTQPLSLTPTTPKSYNP